MAKILNKDPITYERERDGFIRELRHFHDTRGTPFRKIPKINGHEIDLYLLYVLVTAHGGWVKVNSRNEWEPLVDQFNLPKHCVNSGVGLKQIYLRYLDRYEKVHYLGEDGERGSDDDEESRHKRWSARALHSVPFTYNHHQHNVAEGLRAYNGLSTDLYKPSDYDRLALSLIAPLPNEQDFAINVCMLLSNEGKHTLRLDKCPRLLDLLLAHAGVFNHVSLRQLFHEIYGRIRNHSMHHFWLDTLEDDLSDLTDEKQFLTSGKATGCTAYVIPSKSEATTSKGVDASRLVSAEVMEVDSDVRGQSTPSTELDCAATEILFEEDEDGLLCESRPRLKIEPSDYELFCVGRSFGTQDYLGQRVLQIATILRNLSFSEENVAVLSKSVTYLRFLLLCVGSRWNTLHQLGLDMLGNIALEVLVRDPSFNRLSACLITTVTKGISSQDRSIVVSCLEVLNKLSQKDENEEVMLRCIEQQVYDQICKFLTLHDIMLLIQTLECLYSLSSLGERACNCIVRVHGCVDTLVALVTVEAQSYGPKACILMRVVETASAGVATANACTATTATMTAPAAAVTFTTSTPVSRQTPAQPPPRMPVPTPPTPVSTTKAPTIGSPLPAVATPVPVSQQQQHAQQQVAQENEQFALSWLRAACELAVGGRIEQAELYRQYLAACGRIGRRGVIAPLHFPRCVRSVFGGSVGPTVQKSGCGAGDNLPHYDGIKVRAHSASRSALVSRTVAPTALSTDINQVDLPLGANQPSSPILKAQLSAPPKPTKPNTADKSQVGAHPHLTQALLGGGGGEGVKDTPSSLIKSLLASKVNPASEQSMASMASMVPVQCAAVAPDNSMTSVQVTQRQQRLLLQQQQLKKDAAAPVTNSMPKKPLPPKPVDIKPKFHRVNGAKGGIPVELVPQKEAAVESVNGPTADPPGPPLGNGSVSHRGRRDPPVPPLAPLSSGPHQRLEAEDSDSMGNNSIASSSGVSRINASMTDDGENSLTSFEGILLNGIPGSLDLDAASTETSSKDAARCGKTLASKSMMLADLLEKKVDRKDHPILNGVLGRELRIGDKGLELVDNHLDKVLMESASFQIKSNDLCDTNAVKSVIQSTNSVNNNNQCLESINTNLSAEGTLSNDDTRNTLKRPADDALATTDSKRQHLERNGTSDETCATSAADLYAAFAASALEDETDLEIAEQQLVLQDETALRQAYVTTDSSQQQVIVTQGTRQMFVSQQQSQVLITPAGQITLHAAPPPPPAKMVQTAGRGQMSAQMVQGQVVLTQGSSGQLILSQAPQGSVQLGQTHYMVAQQQSTLVQGHQTVLVTQTQQQQGTGAKTLIIFQNQSGSSNSHQKMMVTPQGQPVVVTQVPRPILQSPAVSLPPALVPTSAKQPTPIRPSMPSSTTAASQKVCIPPAAMPVTTPVAKQPAVVARPVVRPPANPVRPVETADTPNGVLAAKNEPPVPPVQPSPVNNQLKTPVIDPSAFLCEWRGCMRSFKSSNEVYMHACESHCPSGSQEIQCLWERCDAMKRKRFSLMTHLYDRHCNAEVLKMMAVRRKQLSQSGRSEIPPPAPPPPHPGYAPNAAFHAIKRHALEFVNPKELMDDNEGPVTKSIRLTSSLILRNLVIYSTNGKRYLRSYEPHLASIALSNVESSRTIAQVLYDMNQQSGGR